MPESSDETPGIYDADGHMLMDGDLHNFSTAINYWWTRKESLRFATDTEKKADEQLNNHRQTVIERLQRVFSLGKGVVDPYDAKKLQSFFEMYPGDQERVAGTVRPRSSSPVRLGTVPGVEKAA